jgi:hypothetical protein
LGAAALAFTSREAGAGDRFVGVWDRGLMEEADANALGCGDAFFSPSSRLHSDADALD